MSALRNIAKGFDIPIIVEDEEMPRPHARSNLLGVQTPVGFVTVPGIHNDNLQAFELNGHVDRQGLPVQAGHFTRARYGCADQHPVVHIDHHKYLPRVPDRDCLIDAEVVSRDIVNVLVGIMREHLRETKAAMPPEAFVTQYWNIAAKLGALDLMCDVPVLPTAKLSVITEDLRRPTEYESSWTAPTEVVTRAQVESGAVVLIDADLCDDEDALEEGDDSGFAKMAFVARKGWVRVDPLPAGHWAIPHIRDIEAMECHVTGTIVATGNFDGSWVFSKVTIVDALTVHLAGESVSLDQAIKGRLDDQEEGGILVPRHATDPASALLQISTYRDENETYMESDHANDINEFCDVVALLNGEDPVETLRKCLRNGASGQRTNLRGKTFTVSFDADGGCTVS